MAQAPAAKTTDQAKSGSTKKAVEAAPAPTDKDIADAKTKGLVWVKKQAGEALASWQTPIAKFLDNAAVGRMEAALGGDFAEGDLLLVGAGSYATVKASLSALRVHLRR